MTSTPSNYVSFTPADESARWRVLCQLKTLYYDTMLFRDGYFGCDNCFLCDMPISIGELKTSRGVLVFRDMTHYLEFHQLMPSRDVVEEIERLYQHHMNRKKGQSDDCMAALQRQQN